MPHALHRLAKPPSASGQPRRQLGVLSVPQLSQDLPGLHLRLNFLGAGDDMAGSGAE